MLSNGADAPLRGRCDPNPPMSTLGAKSVQSSPARAAAMGCAPFAGSPPKAQLSTALLGAVARKDAFAVSEPKKEPEPAGALQKPAPPEAQSAVSAILDSKVGQMLPAALHRQLETVRAVADALHEIRQKCLVAPSAVVNMDPAYLNAQAPALRTVMLFQYYATSYMAEHPLFRKALFHAFYILKRIDNSWLVPGPIKRACRACQDEVRALVNLEPRQHCLDIRVSVALTEASEHVTKSVSDLALRCPSPPVDEGAARRSVYSAHSSSFHERQWHESL